MTKAMRGAPAATDNAPRWSQVVGRSASQNELPPADAVADAVRAAAQQASAPVDLNSVLRQWPGLRVSIEDLDGTGYLLDLGQRGGEILLRSRDSRGRRRFTLAHELGHWLLGAPAVPPHAGGHDSPRVERWCEEFSVNLLLPRAWLAEDVERLKTRPHLARHLARLPKRYGVSRAAALRRVAEVSDVSIFLRDWTQPRGVLAACFVSDQPGPARDLVALKRWAENLTVPLDESEPRAVGGALVVSSAFIADRSETLIASFPRREAQQNPTPA